MQVEVSVLSGEKEGHVEIFAKDLLVFGVFFQEVGDQGRVWGLVENFDKDLLVFGRGSLSCLCK